MDWPTALAVASTMLGFGGPITAAIIKLIPARQIPSDVTQAFRELAQKLDRIGDELHAVTITQARHDERLRTLEGE